MSTAWLLTVPGLCSTSSVRPQWVKGIASVSQSTVASGVPEAHRYPILPYIEALQVYYTSRYPTTWPRHPASINPILISWCKLKWQDYSAVNMWGSQTRKGWLHTDSCRSKMPDKGVYGHEELNIRSIMTNIWTFYYDIYIVSVLNRTAFRHGWAIFGPLVATNTWKGDLSRAPR